MKPLLLSVVFAIGCYAQTTGANVITLPLATNTASTSTVNATSTTLQNIGQSYHSLVINISNIVGGALLIQLTANIQASQDGTNWFNIGTGVTVSLINDGIPVIVTASGSYPWIRVKYTITKTSATSFVYSVTYIGNSTGGGTLVDYLQTRSNTMAFTSTLASPALLANLINHTTGYIVVYGLAVYSDATGTTFDLACVNTAQPSIITPVVHISNLGFIRQSVWPVTLRAYFSCPAGSDLRYSSPGTSVLDLNLTYREEF